MKLINKNISFVFGLLILPLSEMKAWKIEQYSKIPPNQVSISKEGMRVSVKKSASPIFYSFGQQLKIKKINVTGVFSGLPVFSPNSTQGEKGADDFPLRIGLIVPGDKKLGGIKKLFASDWVKRLYEQVPADIGLDHVHFFNLVQNKNLVGQIRVHPSSDLIKEEFIHLIKSSGPFIFEHTLISPLNAVALWLSIDGDDTKSEFDVTITHLEFEYE